MSLFKYVSKYNAEEAIDLLQEVDMSDEDDVTEQYENWPLLEIECKDYCISSSDEDDEFDSDESDQQDKTNKPTWIPLNKPKVEENNEFVVKTGVHEAIQDRVSASPYECWKLFIDDVMLQSIIDHTIREAVKTNPNFTFSMEKLKAFISLQYGRSFFGKHNTIDDLWEGWHTPHLFRNTMTKDCFKEIKHYIRFDNKDEQRQKLVEDKFIHIRNQLEKFVANCQFNYTPERSLTIDEQLLPMKTNCPFNIFVPDKPHRLGMKFWILAEVASEYVYNVLPYLGSLEKEQENEDSLAEDVIMRLTKEIHNNPGYNVTTNFFFTSLRVARLLSQKKITMVGVIARRSEDVTREMSKGGKKVKTSKTFHSDEEDCLFVNYQYSRKKNLNMLSTMHHVSEVDSAEELKSRVFHFFNNNKITIDVADQMHIANRNWPFAVWTYILDIAALNSWIIYKKITESKMKRSDFLLAVMTSLRKDYVKSQSLSRKHHAEGQVDAQQPHRPGSLSSKRRKV